MAAGRNWKCTGRTNAVVLKETLHTISPPATNGKEGVSHRGKTFHIFSLPAQLA
jgi:hypothetical protein